MKRHKIIAIHLHPSLLFDDKNPAAPNGQVHIDVAREYQDDDGAIYTRDVGDAHCTNAELCRRARELFDDIAQHYATENATPVRARVDLAAELVQPIRR